MWQAALGLIGGVVIALLARVPAFSWEGRRLAHIKSEAEALEKMPDSDAKDRFRSELERKIELHLLCSRLEEARRHRMRSMIAMIVMVVLMIGASVFLVWLISDAEILVATDDSPRVPWRLLTGGTIVYVVLLLAVFVVQNNLRAARVEKLALERYEAGERSDSLTEVRSVRARSPR
ncbi:hypothetical protein [Cellulosimicrobium aquatile]|uniref:hypothetical protein n=1 Tax=Cellulosimicrobium aquatile TaxID=1612203 RepID=UPI0014598367|nr:hypothetical protein [Cellulosimicrobium aquatile]NMF29610.1 hypothetical protein [Cellulosimicrobium aquatile]